MPTLTEGKTPGDFLLFEEQDHYSREEVTIAAGADLEPGTVLGMVTATEKYVASDEAGAPHPVARAERVAVEVADRPEGLEVVAHVREFSGRARASGFRCARKPNRQRQPHTCTRSARWVEADTRSPRRFDADASAEILTL